MKDTANGLLNVWHWRPSQSLSKLHQRAFVQKQVVWGSFIPKGPTVQPERESSPNNARNGPPDKCSLLCKPPTPYLKNTLTHSYDTGM